MSNEHRYIVGPARTVKLQLILGLIVVVMFAIGKHNMNSTISAILGAGIAIVATVTYIKAAFGLGVIAYPKDAYVRHKKAMVYRFTINLLMFALVFILYRKCDSLALLVTYCVTFCAYWLALVTKQK